MAKDAKSSAALEVSDQSEYLDKLRNAPIAEFADYAGIDLDLAVQLRIDEAVSVAYEKMEARQGPIAEDIYNKWAAALEQGPPAMEIAVRPIAPMGNLLGFASVTVGGIKVDDFKIVANKDGELFVGMPSKPDKSSNTGYRNTVHVDKDSKEAFQKAVLSAYRAAVEQAKDRASSFRETPDKPRMAEQMDKAAKEAKAHNAAQAPKEKGTKKRDTERA